MTYRVPWTLVAVIFVVCAALQFPMWKLLVSLSVVLGANWIEQALRRREISKIVEYDIYDWTPDQRDNGWEIKGNLTRRKLPDSDQIIVTRISELLERLMS